jgi:hypothetical protein
VRGRFDAMPGRHLGGKDVPSPRDGADQEPDSSR